MRPFLLAVALGVLATGCATISSKPARAQEAAQEMNLNARFGRSQLVMERIAPTEKGDYTRSHHAWGGDVRVTDAELDGFHMKPGDEEAEVNVRVAWYRPDEGELRTTVLRQTWKDYKGAWLLSHEERADGDVGLLGERIVIQKDDTPRPPAQFPTIRIGANEER